MRQTQELLAAMQQHNEVPYSVELCIAPLHTESDPDVFSVAACHSLNLINEAILMESTDSPPLVHFDDQSLIWDCDSAAANVLQVDISAVLVKLKLDLLLNTAD